MNVAVITGAGSGIGKAIALRFSEQDCHVHLVGRRRNKLEETASLVSSATISAIDVAEPNAMAEAVNKVTDVHGGVDFLVACAGVNPQRSATLETGDQEWDETIRTNLTGVHLSCKAVLPAMLLRGGGSIVTIGSISGQVGMAERAAYGPSKAGVIQYTRNLAIDYATHGIRANCICPGFVVTDLVKPWLDSRTPKQLDKVIASHPLGLGKPNDVAGAAWFLCSDDSRWITGIDLSVDGGYTCW